MKKGVRKEIQGAWRTGPWKENSDIIVGSKEWLPGRIQGETFLPFHVFKMELKLYCWCVRVSWPGYQCPCSCREKNSDRRARYPSLYWLRYTVSFNACKVPFSSVYRAAAKVLKYGTWNQRQEEGLRVAARSRNSQCTERKVTAIDRKKLVWYRMQQHSHSLAFSGLWIHDPTAAMLLISTRF
jgi:hypothetical protein